MLANVLNGYIYMCFTRCAAIVCSLRHALCSKHNTSWPLQGGAGGSSAAVGIGGVVVGGEGEEEEEYTDDSGFELTEVKEAACQVERVRERG